jgi:hypothetical protein
MNTKRLENWNGPVAVARKADGTFGPGAQGLALELWNTRKGVVVKAVRRDSLGRIEGPTNFATKITFA